MNNHCLKLLTTIVLLALVGSGSGQSIKITEQTNLAAFNYFLSQYQLIVDNTEPGATTLIRGDDFESNSTWVSVPGSGKGPFESGYAAWPFNGVYGAFAPWTTSPASAPLAADSGFRFVLSTSVGPSQVLLVNCSQLPPTVLATQSLSSLPGLRSCAPYLLTGDPARKGVWLTCNSGIFFATGMGTAKVAITQVTANLFAGTSLAGFSLTSISGSQPIGAIVGDVMYVVAINYRASQAAIVALRLSAPGQPLSVAYEPSLGLYNLSAITNQVINQCAGSVFIFPQPDGQLLVSLPAWVHPRETFYCNGEVYPNVTLTLLNGQNLAQASTPQFATDQITYSSFAMYSFGSQAPNFFLLKGYNRDVFDQDWTVFQLVSYSDGVITFYNSFQVRYIELYNYQWLSVLASDGTIRTLVDEIYYTITLTT